METLSSEPNDFNPADSSGESSLIINGETTVLPIAKPLDDTIRLQVGERHFTTYRSTLVEESTYFESFLSGRWNTAREDGSYFIDADPDLFVHILRYLRRGVFPVFFDLQKGHDYALYDLLLKEASFFGITELESYLSNRKYVDRVVVAQSMHELENNSGIVHRERSDTMVEYSDPQWIRTGRKIYLCPRRIEVHRGNPSRCGRQCRNWQGSDPDEYDEEQVLKVLTVHKRVYLAP